VDGAGFLCAVKASDALLPVFTSVELIMMRSQNRKPLSGHFLPVALGALLMTAWVGAVPASGQSFDCRNARYADEKAICRESRLGELDKELSAAYDRVGGKLSRHEREEFENNETAFVNARHRCGEHQGCIEQSYRNRLQELRAALPDEESDRSASRATSTKRTDRQKTSNRDREKTEEGAKIEDERAEPRDAKLHPAETAVPSSERKAEPGETGPATALPSPSLAEKRSRHKETGSTGSVTPNPPSREEAQAAIAGSAAPEKRDRHEKRSRHKESVSSVSASSTAPPPEHEKQPTTANTAVSERHSSASGSSTAAAQPVNPPERRHSKTKTVTAGAPASPEPHPAPAKAAGGGGGTQWVNPSPSP
jgi:uncharacterized protein